MTFRPGPFPIVTTVLVLVLAYGLASMRPELGAWQIILPVLLGTVTFLFTFRMRRDSEPVITRHNYALVAPAAAPGASVGPLLAALAAKGYQLDAERLDDEGRPVGAAPVDLALAGAQLRVVERRAKDAHGALTVRLRAEASGALVGFVEADDTGPGIYDELAQYAILALAGLVPDLQFTRMARDAQRRPATTLTAELPERPYGLGLLG